MRTPPPPTVALVLLALVGTLAACTPDEEPPPTPTPTAAPSASASPEPSASPTPTLTGPVDSDLLVRAAVAEVFEVAADEVHVHLVGVAAQDGTDDGAACPSDGAPVDGATEREGRDLVPGAFFGDAQDAGSPWTVHVRWFEADDPAAAVTALDARAAATVACGAHPVPAADAAGEATSTWTAGDELGDHATWQLVVASAVDRQAGALLYAEDVRGGVVELTVSELGSDDPADAAARLEALLALVTAGATLPPAPADAHLTGTGLPSPTSVERVAHLLPGARDPASPLAQVLEVADDLVTLRDDRAALNGVGPQAVYVLETAATAARRPWALDGAATLAAPTADGLVPLGSWTVQVRLVPDDDERSDEVASLTSTTVGDDHEEVAALDGVQGYAGAVWTRSTDEGTDLHTIGTAGPFAIEVRLTADADEDALRAALAATVTELLAALAAA